MSIVMDYPSRITEQVLRNMQFETVFKDTYIKDKNYGNNFVDLIIHL